MVIGIDASRVVSSQPTGTESYTYHLTKALIPLAADRGYQIRLYFNQKPQEDLFPAADHLEQIIIPFPRLWSHVKLARELKRVEPDIFFTPAHVIPYGYRGISVATVHDLGYHHFPDAHTRWQLRYLKWSTRNNIQRGTRVIADSQSTKEDLIRVYNVSETKVDVVYPGLDPSIQPVTDQEELSAVQHKYGISPPYLLYIGTLQPRKNLNRLIRAFIQSDAKQQLVIAGKAGWRSKQIIKTAFDYQSLATNNIVLSGFVASEDKAALISGAEALMYPSLYEGFGFPVLEANACGTPVLCANTSSLPEIAGKAALLVDPNDTAAISEAINQIVTDKTLREELIKQGLANVLRFNWESTANQVMSTLERACRGSD